jgi:hypothetical protein
MGATEATVSRVSQNRKNHGKNKETKPSRELNEGIRGFIRESGIVV